MGYKEELVIATSSISMNQCIIPRAFWVALPETLV